MQETFHFLRPWWFLALLPALILFVLMLKRSRAAKTNWARYCDPHLLPHLITESQVSAKMPLAGIILTLWVIIILALAGPTWSLYATPVYQKNIARVIALDVSQSMNANDIQPSRLQRAKYKVLDILHTLKEGQTGMLVFSSAAFVVAPLTTDTNTIASMVPILNSDIVPVQGSDITKALHKAGQLLSQAGFTTGQIILITDSKPSSQAIAEAQRLKSLGYNTSVLAVGSSRGGPVSDARGNFETDSQGNIVFSYLDSRALQQLATAGAGSYIPFTNDDTDLNQLLKQANLAVLDNKSSERAETKSLWRDEGHWLIWLAILLCAFIARSGWLEKIC